MNSSQTARFGFRIRTRSGAVVDNLLFFGRDAIDAERKLRQIYLGCEILESRRLLAQSARSGPLTFEDVVDLLADPSVGWPGDGGGGERPDVPEQRLT